MNESIAAGLVGGLASLITSVQVTRQVYDVYKVTDPSGVSLITWLMVLVQSVGLLILSLANGLIVGSFINAYVGVATLVMLPRLGRVSPRGRGALALVGGALISAGVVGLAWAFGPAGAGTLGAVASVCAWIPQGVRAFRSRSSSGLSLVSLSAGIIASVLWLLYAILVDEWRFALAPLSAIVFMSITVWYAILERDGS